MLNDLGREPVRFEPQAKGAHGVKTLMGIYNPVGRARNSNRPMVGFSLCGVFGKKDVLFL